jgi:hypothetical protein
LVAVTCCASVLGVLPRAVACTRPAPRTSSEGLHKVSDPQEVGHRRPEDGPPPDACGVPIAELSYAPDRFIAPRIATIRPHVWELIATAGCRRVRLPASLLRATMS